MRKALTAAAAALVFSACTTDPDTICFDDWIYSDDVYGAGHYSEYREEFEKENDCTSPLLCEKNGARMKVRKCVDNVEFK